MHVKYLRRNLSLLLVIAAGMLAAGTAVGIQNNAPEKPHIEFFDVENTRLPDGQGNFVAESKGIKRMEVWIVPKAMSGEEDWGTLGLMQRTSHWFSWAAWELPIPPSPIAAYQIMVWGYDENGEEVDRVTLPWIGEKMLREKIWKIENGEWRMENSELILILSRIVKTTRTGKGK